MDFLASPLGVFVILAIVTLAVIFFDPAKVASAWRELVARYATDQRPASIGFPNEVVSLANVKSMRIDVTLDEDGLWLLHPAQTPGQLVECVFLPWDCVRYRQEADNRQNFQLRGRDPIELWVSRELGTAMQRRSLRFEIEGQL